MKVTLRASTGAKILVWRENDSFHSRLADSNGDPRICSGMALFEAIAERAELDLEAGPQSVEAMRLAEKVERRLRASGGAGADGSLRLQSRG